MESRTGSFSPEDHSEKPDVDPEAGVLSADDDVFIEDYDLISDEYEAELFEQGLQDDDNVEVGPVREGGIQGRHFAGWKQREILADIAARKKVLAGLDVSNEKYALLIQEIHDAEQLLVRSNASLVWAIIKRYYGSALSDGRFLSGDDIFQAGCIGLLTAIRRYDENKGAALSTYAVLWIRQAIGRTILNEEKTIRLPVHVYEAIGKIRNAKSQCYLQEGITKPTFADLARYAEMSIERVKQVLSLPEVFSEAYYNYESDEELSILDRVRERSDLGPEYQLRDKEQHDELMAIIDERLDPAERNVIMFRFGLKDGQEHTLESIGERIGLTRERVRQIEKKALLKLRNTFTKITKGGTGKKHDVL